MRQLKEIPLFFNKRIVGKITKNPNKAKGKKNCVFVAGSILKRAKGFKAVLTSEAVYEKEAQLLKLPIIHSIRDIDILSEGDIVSLDMRSGEVIVLYEINSVHNSILASTDCNCRCIMCPQALTEGSPDNLKTNLEIIRLIDRKTAALGITGGEPTLLGDLFLELLKECKKRLPETQIQVLTNGILLNSKYVVEKIVRLGIKSLVFCVPLYSDTDREHDFIMQRNGAFEDTVQGIYNLAAKNQLVEIRIVVMSLNYRRLPQIAEFIYHNLPFAIHIAFMGMEIEGQAKKNIQKLWASPIEYAQYLKEAVIYLSLRNMSVSIYNEQLCLMPKEIWSFMRKSISEWKNTYMKICGRCKVKNECGGFFAQAIEEHERLIRPL